MNARLVLACALSGAALVLGGAGTAAAELGDTTIEITPQVVMPGETVDIRATCEGNYTPSPIHSEVFDPQSGWLHLDGIKKLTATVTIRDSAPHGTWPATFTCDGQVGMAEIQVGPGDNPEPDDTEQVEVKPVGAPETGAGTPASGNAPAGLVVGAGAVLLGVGGMGVAALTRRRRT